MSPLGWSWLIFCSLAVVIANVLLRIGIDRSGVSLFSGGVYGLPLELINLVGQPLFLVALAFYGVAMLSWFRLVSTEPLSVAYPVLAALTFVAITVVATFLFAEPFSARKAAGLIAIVIGLYLVSTI
jgi:multidrug transporter EmrE-like cation transporter